MGNPGVVIRNTSQTRDVLAVEVTVAWMTKGGEVMGQDGDGVAVIPAATTFYWGDQSSLHPGVPARIDVNLAYRSATRRYRLPVVSNCA
jgi:hypothetical protein